ncbi:MAG: hypothetical protein K0R50_4397 [Eubacterium sp.]|nr:hypothetical protein [Eubacterium sp.]
MLSTQTIVDLNSVIDNIDSRIEQNKDKIDTKELDYLTYQKIKIQQLIDDIHHKQEFFNG